MAHETGEPQATTFVGVGRWLLPLPALVALGLVFRFGVDVPYMDGWDTPGALLARATGHPLALADLVGQHNESRPAFPRMIFAALAWTVGWHAKLYMLLSWGCVAVTGWALQRLAARRLHAGGWALGISFLLQALLFSPIQHQNQLWGVQLVVYVPAACLATMLVLASTSRPLRVVFPACMALAFVATYSYANGMICWLLGCPAPWLALRRRARGASETGDGSLALWTAAWALATLAVVGAYFHDYQTPAHHAGFAALWNEPARVAGFLLAWLGLPAHAISRDVAGAQAVGLALVVAGAAVLAPPLWRGIVRREWRLLSDLSPWLVLLAYGAASGMVTAAGRSFLGMEAALSGRYASFAIWIPIGVLGAMAASWPSEGAGRRTRAARNTLVVAVASLAAWSWVRGVSLLPDHQHGREQTLLTLRFTEALPRNPLLAQVYPVPDVVRERAAILRAHDILRIAPAGSFVQHALLLPPQDPASGGWSFRRLGQGQIILSAIAKLPGTGRVPEAVLVAVEMREGGPLPLTVLAPTPRSAEPRFVGLLPLDAQLVGSKLRLYALDLGRETLHPLPRVRTPRRP